MNTLLDYDLLYNPYKPNKYSIRGQIIIVITAYIFIVFIFYFFFAISRSLNSSTSNL